MWYCSNFKQHPVLAARKKKKEYPSHFVRFHSLHKATDVKSMFDRVTSGSNASTRVKSGRVTTSRVTSGKRKSSKV